MSDHGKHVSRRTALTVGLSVAACATLTEAKRKHHKRRKHRRNRAVLTRTSTASQPDVLVFLTDDMRTDDWPILQQAKSRIGGTWFPNFCFDVSVCAASRATFFTGQDARVHGVKNNDNADQLFRSREGDSLAPAVQAAGYHTGYVGKYINLFNGNRIPPGWSDWRAMVMKGDTYTAGGTYVTSEITSRARQVILSAPTDKSLFLVVSHHAPHEPHTPAKRYEKKRVGGARNQADRERKRCLLSVDDSVAATADAMGERWNSAIVLFMSDNGFLLGEHGTDGKAIWWDQAARCPMLARVPGITGGTDSRMVSNRDVCPTLLRATGATAWWTMQGQPLQDTWTRDGVLIQGFQSQSSGEPRTHFAAIKGPGWVYVEPVGKAPQYYADPAESTNAIATIDQPAYAAWLQELLGE